MVTVESFTLDISRWVAKAKGNTERFAIEFIQDLNQAVVENPGHPLKTGFLRGSWHAAIGAPPDGVLGGAPDMSGALTVSTMNLVAAELKIGDTYYARNGASYAYFVEYGTSKMAARAFVRGPLANWRAIGDATAARIASS